MKKLALRLTTILAAGMLFAGSALALDYDFSGSFRQDNDVLRFNFAVGAPSDVTIFSSSWVSGGFDPILAIWNGSGSLVYQQDDGGVVGSTASNGISYAHGTWDSYYHLNNLAAGSYIATVAQYNNFAVGNQLSQGFKYDSNPNFTYDNNYGGATQPFFNGVWDSNDPRTADWAFHILNVDQAVVVNNPVPEPSTMLLLGGGLAGLAFWRKRKNA